MFCNYCAAVNPDDSLFCSACGRSIPPRNPVSPKTGSMSVAPVVEGRDPVHVFHIDTSEQSKYSATYALMSDDELVHLKSEMGTLTDNARAALLAEVVKRNLQDAPNPQIVSKTESTTERLYGVHGWLAWFVFVRLLVAPIAFLVRIVNEYELANAPGMDSSVATLYWLIDAALCFGFACWSIYCGISLLKLKRNAPRITKAYFVGLFFYFVLGAVFTIAASPKSGSGSHDIGVAIVPFLQGFAGIIVWYEYLERSKRVANTYTVT